MAAHALLSASKAEKWFNCPPSARLEEQLPDTVSDYAKEGTLAHAIVELMIKYNHHLGLTKRTYMTQLKKLQADPLYQPEMLEHAQNFASYVFAAYQEALKTTSDAKVLPEEKMDYSHFVPEGFGICDVHIVGDDTLQIMDFKYGRGVSVSAEDNKQLMLYALGALRRYDFLYDIRNVKMTIYQPRIDSISESEISVNDLTDWAENELKPRALLAFKGEGEFCPGEHCASHFCKVAATCRARRDKNMELAKYDFADPPTLTDDEIAEILLTAKELEKWASDIWKYAQAEALKGKCWPNFKLVEGISRRAYTDRAKILETLIGGGYDADMIAPRELLGITDMEKALTKARFHELLEGKGYVVKPSGKPALVHISDKRPEINSTASAAKDFDDDYTINEEDVL